MTRDRSLPSSKRIALPRGICSLCSTAVSIKGLNLSKEFPCPNCGRLVTGSRLYRALSLVAFLVGPTFLLWHSSWPVLVRILVWPVLGFACCMIYLFIAMTYLEQRLEKPRKKRDPDEFQTLGLD
jgi:predicted RNA-binding Zn-ribbon protein involved in translation (DUF1610 family)